MALAKSDLVTGLNSQLNRAETAETIAKELTKTLSWFSKKAKFSCLWKTEDVEIEAGDEYIDLSELTNSFRIVDTITLNDGTYDYEPLLKMADNYTDLKKERAYETSANRARPEYFAKKGEAIYLYPVTDGDYTATVGGYIWHPDTDNLLFDDEFEDALVDAACYMYLKSKGMFDRAAVFSQLAANAINDMGEKTDFSPRFTRYCDL